MRRGRVLRRTRTSAARQQAGIGRYTRELVTALLALRSPHQYTLFAVTGGLDTEDWRLGIGGGVRFRTLPISAENWSLVQQGMAGAVEYGTSWRTQIEGPGIAGKTGTAQYCDDIALDEGSCAVGKDLPEHAWFTAFAPVEEPEISVIVFLYHGGEGSTMAVPVPQSAFTTGGVGLSRQLKSMEKGTRATMVINAIARVTAGPPIQLGGPREAAVRSDLTDKGSVSNQKAPRVADQR